MVEDLWRKYNEVHEDLKKKFSDVDVWWRRDDVDAYQAAQLLLDSYSNVDKNFCQYNQGSIKKYYSEEIIQEYKTLRNKLKSEETWTKNNTRHYPWTSASDHIKRLAARINEVEWRVYQQRQIVMMRQLWRNLIHESEWNSGKRYMNIIKSEKMQFLKDSNNVNILTAMSAFFRRFPNEQYRIDYSTCKDEKLKKKIKDQCGSYVAIIKYNPTTRTCPLYNIGWQKIKDLAPISEWITIESLKQRANLQEAMQAREMASEVDYNDKYKTEEAAKSLIEKIPSSLVTKLRAKKMLLPFVNKCEARLDEIVKRKKQQWTELRQDDPISRVYVGTWLMEAHFKNPTQSQVIFAWKETSTDKKPNKLPWELYDLLNSNEWDLKTYLKSRIMDKWWVLDNYAMRNFKVKALDVRDPVNSQERQYQTNQIYAIDKCVESLEHFMTKWYNKQLKKLLDHCKDMKSSLDNIISQGKWVNWSDWNTQKEVMKTLFIDYKNHDGSWASMRDVTAKQYIDNIFNKTSSRETIQLNVRDLFTWLTTRDNASTSGVTDDVESDLLDDSDNVELGSEYEKRRSECEKALKNINNIYWVSFEESWEIVPLNAKNNIDELYNALDDSYPSLGINKPNYTQWAALYVFLQGKGIIPKDAFPWYDSEATRYRKGDWWFLRWELLDPDIKKCFDNLYNSLKDRRDAYEKTNLTGDDVKDALRKENSQYESKWYLTDEEKQRYQINEAIMDDPEALEKFAKWQTELTKSMIKYVWVNNVIHKSISAQIIKVWGWFPGNTELQNLYNDAKWFWWFLDFSDETNEAIWDNAIQVIVEVIAAAIVSVLTWGVWATYLAGMLAKLWSWARKCINLFKSWAKTIILWIKNTRAYEVISRVLDLKYVWKTIVTEAVKWWDINPITNPWYFIESWIYGKVAGFMWKVGTNIRSFVKEKYKYMNVVRLFENSGNLFGKISVPVIWKWKDVSWEALLAMVGTIDKIQNHPDMENLIDKQVQRAWTILVDAICEEEWWYKAMTINVGDGDLCIDSSWNVIRSSILEIPERTNVF